MGDVDNRRTMGLTLSRISSEVEELDLALGGVEHKVLELSVLDREGESGDSRVNF